jgi:hypothetical protein
MAYITVAEVREEMLDRQAEDHLVLADLAFTDEDIEWAMRRCAREFNTVRPMTTNVTWDKLPDETTVFFDGIAWALLARWRRNVAMNDLDYNAGGVAASVQGTLLKNLDRLVQELSDKFIRSATDMKLTDNLNQAWGRIG